MSQALNKSLRTQLENTVKAARDVADAAALAALRVLCVGEGKLSAPLSEEQKSLRRRLRAHGRALGDIKHKDESQSLTHLGWEVAYEHWHRMLFARFLAENHLLMWEPGAPVTLDECATLSQDPATSLGTRSKWELAGKLAARMLPQVFKPKSPVFELSFAPEHQRELERLLANLAPETFQASDSLGWVYQFWQAKRKDEVNASEVKIGADELPAVTQLFTEPYMVEFLLHNSLGAWWVTRYPGQACPAPLTYLRTLEDGTPAAGKFEGWPETLTEFKLLDPCCGSGHFLVAAFLLLVPMRMADEGLSAVDAVDAVLANNLHGLELDPRCVEIAVFALALAAWRFPDENGNALGVRANMSAPNIACCGLKVAARAQDWEAMVPESHDNAVLLRQELRLLHSSFAQAPLLGSLLDPARSLKNDLATSSFDTLKSLLEQALASEAPSTNWGRADEINDDAWDLALTARGLLEAARLLEGRYDLVITNVPYRSSLDLHASLRGHIENNYDLGKTNLATAFLLRCLELCRANAGSVNVVLPQDWLVQPTYGALRQDLVKSFQIDYVIRLGPGAFREITGEVVNVALLGIRHNQPAPLHLYSAFDCGRNNGHEEKDQLIRAGSLSRISQSGVLKNPGFSIFLAEQSGGTTFLGERASSVQGIKTGDDERLVRVFWEVDERAGRWLPLQSTVASTNLFGGLEKLVDWSGDGGLLARKQGLKAWRHEGVAMSQMSSLPCALYAGGAFDSNVTVIFPKNACDLPALLNFAFSGELSRQVREFDQSIKPTNSSFEKVHFSAKAWSDKGPVTSRTALPQPYSDDATQRVFHGYPRSSVDPLQVSVARLLGYRWPTESGAVADLSDEARAWISRCETLRSHVDDDGIVCLSSVRGEKPAHQRLLTLLIDAWESVEKGSWKSSTLDKLLAEADCAGKGLEVWLRDKFFEQHAKRFHHRPFIWHIWDGLKDGFGALVNYHKLDAKNLDRLIHTYLGEWISQQEAGVRDKVDGAAPRLAAALDLKSRLEKIVVGEPPYDIFVRWKPLAEQRIGWNPDLDDGVRLNIRPFMTADVLRHNKPPKLNIDFWGNEKKAGKDAKDRGKDVESAPWFKVFKGERINDHHLTLEEKKNAREKQK